MGAVSGQCIAKNTNHHQLPKFPLAQASHPYFLHLNRWIHPPHSHHTTQNCPLTPPAFHFQILISPTSQSSPDRIRALPRSNERWKCQFNAQKCPKCSWIVCPVHRTHGALSCPATAPTFGFSYHSSTSAQLPLSSLHLSSNQSKGGFSSSKHTALNLQKGCSINEEFHSNFKIPARLQILTSNHRFQRERVVFEIFQLPFFPLTPWRFFVRYFSPYIFSSSRPLPRDCTAPSPLTTFESFNLATWTVSISFHWPLFIYQLQLSMCNCLLPIFLSTIQVLSATMAFLSDTIQTFHFGDVF